MRLVFIFIIILDIFFTRVFVPKFIEDNRYKILIILQRSESVVSQMIENEIFKTAKQREILRERIRMEEYNEVNKLNLRQ